MSKKHKKWLIGSQKNHDDLEDRVEKELESKGWENITKGTKYKAKNSKGQTRDGEVDIYATKHGRYVLIGECKSGKQNTKKSDKAIGQLYRAVTRLFNKTHKNHRKFPMYIHPNKETGENEYEWIRFTDAGDKTRGEYKF